MNTIPIRSERQKKTIDFCSIDDLPSLVWVANLADLELHTSLVVGEEPGPADGRGLRPGPRPAQPASSSAAPWPWRLRKLFTELGLEAYPKTSGSKGMQIYLPLNSKDTYEESKSFAHAVAGVMEQQLPNLVVSDMKKELRKGKVLIDWSQNDYFKTTVCVYSLRAKQTPTVSTPLTWDEVAATEKSGDPDDLKFTYTDALQRVDEHSDLFAPVLTQKQTLPSFRRLPR